MSNDVFPLGDDASDVEEQGIYRHEFNCPLTSVSDPDLIHFGQSEPDPGSKKLAKIMENLHKIQPKSSISCPNCWLTVP